MARLVGEDYELEVVRAVQEIPDPCVPPCGAVHNAYLETPPEYFLTDTKGRRAIGYETFKALAAEMRMSHG